MNVTNIYGLFDPRNPDVIMYVGKGLPRRSEHHWKRFITQGTAVNALLRRWFASLQAHDIVPSWRILEEVAVESWEKRERYWIAYWRALNPNLCNIAPGGNAASIDACRIGGRIGGRINGGKNFTKESCSRGGRNAHKLHPDLARENGRIGGRIAVESGHWAQIISKVTSNKEHQSHAGRIGGPKGARNQSHDAKSRGGRNCPREASSRGGRIGNHRRHHQARGLTSHACKLCNEEAITNAHLLKPFDVVDFIDQYLSPASAGWTDCVEVAA